MTFENEYAALGEAFGAHVPPTPLPEPYPVAWNPDVARLLELGPTFDDTWLRAMTGHASLPGARPVAMVYSGHQFGVYVPRLGDGRALLLGELRGTDGARYELHVKGAGPTPYSRGGDGRAVLRSTIREYLASEAMAGLGIPTTRALCIAGSDQPIYREEVETAAVLVRVAPTHVRLGTFEYFAHTGRIEELRRLADHVVARLLPEQTARPEAERWLALVRLTVERTAALIAGWQAVGFCHGVMNTDNLSVAGLTLDYGPYGFVEHFDIGYDPNHSDPNGRYALDQQPAVGLWNLTRFAEALLPLLPQDQLVAELERYAPALDAAYRGRMQEKLGLRTEREEDKALLFDLIALLHSQHADYTRFFRALSRIETDPQAVRDELPDPGAAGPWLARYEARLCAEPDPQRSAAMLAANPKYILRTHLAQAAIERATRRDFTEIERLRQLLSRPFDEQPEHEASAHPLPGGSGHLALSCSS